MIDFSSQFTFQFTLQLQGDFGDLEAPFPFTATGTKEDKTTGGTVQGTYSQVNEILLLRCFAEGQNEMNGRFHRRVASVER